MFGIYKMVPVEKLIIDYTYQRIVRPSFIKYLTENWDESMVRTLEVHEVGNGFYRVSDGGHRLVVLKAKGYTSAPCIIHPRSSISKEAIHFKRANGEVNVVRKLEGFWADVAARSSDALEILGIVEKNGLQIARHTNSHDDMKNKIQAIGKILHIKKMFGTNILDRTLSFIVATWPGNGFPLKGVVIEGLAIFLQRYIDNPVFSLQLAKRKFSLVDTEIALSQARNQAKIYDSSPQYIIPDIFVKHYNKRLSDGKKLQK